MGTWAGAEPLNEATAALGSEVLTTSQTLTPCFTKEQENEAELLRANSSGSELLPKDHHHLRGVSWDPLAPFWPFLFPPVVIPVTFPACTPLPGQMHLSIHCLPTSPLGANGPLGGVDPAAPHAQEAQPHLPWLLSPDTWCKRAGVYGLPRTDSVPDPLLELLSEVWRVI